MKPSTSSTATGSLSADSASSVRATFLLRVEPRRTENTAALSVAARIDPRSNPSSTEKSNSQAAANPAITAVRMVPTNASPLAARRTGLTSSKPAARPPSNRISASAITPTVCASS